jgi:hypothetical protein
MVLLSQAGSPSFLDECHLLVVGHAVDVPQVLFATLGSVFRKMSLGSGRKQGCGCPLHGFALQTSLIMVRL